MPQRGPHLRGRADVPELTRVKWKTRTEAAVPAFTTAVMMPFSHHRGDAAGFISYCVMKGGTSRWREINPCVLVVALRPQVCLSMPTRFFFP